MANEGFYKLFVRIDDGPKRSKALFHIFLN